MTKFVPCDREQPFLLPVDTSDWVPSDDLAHFVIETVDHVDFQRFRVNERGTGSAQYEPRMMLALLIHRYASGIFSSRRIERAACRDIGVRFVAANLHPDRDTIAKFRRENFDAVAECFLQVLLPAREVNVLEVGTVSVDGTRMDGSASKHRSVTYARAGELIEQLQGGGRAGRVRAQGAGARGAQRGRAGAAAAERGAGPQAAVEPDGPRGRADAREHAGGIPTGIQRAGDGGRGRLAADSRARRDGQRERQGRAGARGGVDSGGTGPAGGGAGRQRVRERGRGGEGRGDGGGSLRGDGGGGPPAAARFLCILTKVISRSHSSESPLIWEAQIPRSAPTRCSARRPGSSFREAGGRGARAYPISRAWMPSRRARLKL